MTLNLEQWADLPLMQLTEQLYAFKQGGALDVERLRLCALGVQLFRAQEPERFEVRATGPEDLALVYPRSSPQGLAARRPPYG